MIPSKFIFELAYKNSSMADRHISVSSLGFAVMGVAFNISSMLKDIQEVSIERQVELVLHSMLPYYFGDIDSPAFNLCAENYEDKIVDMFGDIYGFHTSKGLLFPNVKEQEINNLVVCLSHCIALSGYAKMPEEMTEPEMSQLYSLYSFGLELLSMFPQISTQYIELVEEVAIFKEEANLFMTAYDSAKEGNEEGEDDGRVC